MRRLAFGLVGIALCATGWWATHRNALYAEYATINPIRIAGMKWRSHLPRVNPRENVETFAPAATIASRSYMSLSGDFTNVSLFVSDPHGREVGQRTAPNSAPTTLIPHASETVESIGGEVTGEAGTGPSQLIDIQNLVKGPYAIHLQAKTNDPFWVSVNVFRPPARRDAFDIRGQLRAGEVSVIKLDFPADAESNLVMTKPDGLQIIPIQVPSRDSPAQITHD
jgi:hypothetical protein